jgi:hypothetical protein
VSQPRLRKMLLDPSTWLHQWVGLVVGSGMSRRAFQNIAYALGSASGGLGLGMFKRARKACCVTL